MNSHHSNFWHLNSVCQIPTLLQCHWTPQTPFSLSVCVCHHHNIVQQRPNPPQLVPTTVPVIHAEPWSWDGKTSLVASTSSWFVLLVVDCNGDPPPCQAVSPPTHRPLSSSLPNNHPPTELTSSVVALIHFYHFLPSYSIMLSSYSAAQLAWLCIRYSNNKHKCSISCEDGFTHLSHAQIRNY